MIPTPRINTGQSTLPQMVVAPIGGLNGRDPIAAMSPTDAILMDNVFPSTASVDSRKGSEKLNAAIPLAGAVESLEVYSGNGADILLAWANSKVYNASTAVPIELMVNMPYVSNRVITTMFSNAADVAQHLIVVTGSDTPRSYEGDIGLNDLAYTDIELYEDDPTTEKDLNFVFTFKGRLYFGCNGRLGFYYLPPGQIQGALSYFDLGQQSSLGGTLLAIASFSDSNGTTPQDYIVFITTKGELIVYMGYDPSNAATWELVGRYYTGTPIGNRCTINYGSELVILTLDGAIPFSEVRRSGDAKSQGVTGSQYTALTSKLGTLLSVFNINSEVPGWQGVQYSRGGWLLLNVPVDDSISGRYYHYVMNTTTRAWCRFTGWNGLCFVVFNKRLYYGRKDGYVMLADEGRFDDEQPIMFDVQTAYNYFEDGNGLGPLQKHFQWATLLISYDGSPSVSAAFTVDFADRAPDYPAAAPPTGDPIWNEVLWDTEYWADYEKIRRLIITLNIAGIAGSLRLRGTLNGYTFKWYNTQYTMQKTRGLLI